MLKLNSIALTFSKAMPCIKAADKPILLQTKNTDQNLVRNAYENSFP